MESWYTSDPLIRIGVKSCIFSKVKHGEIRVHYHDPCFVARCKFNLTCNGMCNNPRSKLTSQKLNYMIISMERKSISPQKMAYIKVSHLHKISLCHFNWNGIDDPCHPRMDQVCQQSIRIKSDWVMWISALLHAWSAHLKQKKLGWIKWLLCFSQLKQHKNNDSPGSLGLLCIIVHNTLELLKNIFL